MTKRKKQNKTNENKRAKEGTCFEEKRNSYSSVIRTAFNLTNNKLKINDNSASAVRRPLFWTQ